MWLVSICIVWFSKWKWTNNFMIVGHKMPLSWLMTHRHICIYFKNKIIIIFSSNVGQYPTLNLTLWKLWKNENQTAFLNKYSFLRDLRQTESKNLKSVWNLLTSFIEYSFDSHTIKAYLKSWRSFPHFLGIVVSIVPKLYILQKFFDKKIINHRKCIPQ